MNNTLANLLLVGLLAAIPMTGVAQTGQQEVGDRSCEQVDEMLAAGDMPAEVIAAMVDAGMTLAGATVFSMTCAPAERREALAEAGVGLAPNISVAESVVAAVAYTYSEGSPEALAASKAFDKLRKTFKQPQEYRPKNSPGQSNGVSPS